MSSSRLEEFFTPGMLANTGSHRNIWACHGPNYHTHTYYNYPFPGPGNSSNHNNPSPNSSPTNTPEMRERKETKDIVWPHYGPATPLATKSRLSSPKPLSIKEKRKENTREKRKDKPAQKEDSYHWTYTSTSTSHTSTTSYKTKTHTPFHRMKIADLVHEEMLLDLERLRLEGGVMTDEEFVGRLGVWERVRERERVERERERKEKERRREREREISLALFRTSVLIEEVDARRGKRGRIAGGSRSKSVKGREREREEWVRWVERGSGRVLGGGGGRAE
ncbi:hypothetical protein B0J11DRAFT_504284 [Dendryphion nanum]|uniref:Uncharacterized protein n=1 Tax=Dendryphion nanum TaxID=256645 RepID=A0A9P9ITH0_9PLEO|nr:hypothetical protein B0J11DRAFT_504284 [Dendryphion nanum]